MAGVGDHMKAIITKWIGAKTGGCGGCERLLKDMNKWGPEGCRHRLKKIVPQIQRNAQRNRDWKARILARIPGIRAPIVAIVFLAIARAEEDIRTAEEEAAKVKP